MDNAYRKRMKELEWMTDVKPNKKLRRTIKRSIKSSDKKEIRNGLSNIINRRKEDPS